MSRFSKFCKFLSQNGEGLKLVAFFIAAQQLFIAHNEQDPDFPLLKGLLRLGYISFYRYKCVSYDYSWTDKRDRFFDETSCWCLPKIMLSDRFNIDGHVLQPNNIGNFLFTNLKLSFFVSPAQMLLLRLLFGDVQTSAEYIVPILATKIPSRSSNERSHQRSFIFKRTIFIWNGENQRSRFASTNIQNNIIAFYFDIEHFWFAHNKNAFIGRLLI